MGFNPFTASSWKKVGDDFVSGVTAGQCDGGGCGSHKAHSGNVYKDLGDAAVSAMTFGQCDGGGCGSHKAHSGSIYKDALDSVQDTTQSALKISSKIPVVGPVVGMGVSIATKIPGVGGLFGSFLGVTPPDPDVQDAIDNGEQLPDDATAQQRLEYWYYSQPKSTQQIILYGALGLGAYITLELFIELIGLII